MSAEQRRLSQDEAIAIFERWVRIAFLGHDPNGQVVCPPARQDKLGPTVADIRSSLLLPRLLRGEPLYVEPPPRMFLHPAYEFCEGKRVRCFDVHGWTHPPVISPNAKRVAFADLEPGHIVLINQGRWIVEARDGDRVVVRWPESSWVGRLEPDHDDRLDRPVWHLSLVSGPSSVPTTEGES